MMSIIEVNEKIKQRPPFQFVDRIVELTPNEYAKAIKCVSINEPYFVGHFPDAPIMPGVLIIECCAQTCSACIELDSDKINVLLKADNFKFMKAIIPGDVMEITVQKTRSGGTLYVYETTVRVEGAVYAKGTLTFTVADKSLVYGR